MLVQPYLFFDGRLEEALELYRRVLGAEATSLMRYKENPDSKAKSTIPPGGEDKVLHASLRIGDSIVHASDGRCLGKPVFQGFSLSITVPKDADAERIFAALADGGQVHVPLTKTFFSSRFGMVDDKFGVPWMVMVGP